MRLPVAMLTILTANLAVSGALLAENPPDFAGNGRPFLETHCLRCHNEEKAEGSLTVAGFRDLDSVVKHRKTWETIVKRVANGEMPPEDEPRPTPEEVNAFTEHLRALFDYSDRHAQPDPGRVTMRRLNRVEYRNTIRDLIGIDFDPTEDFPSDDVGHGFDNIGDVLTLSPVLMERYLAAAESITARAITPIPPQPTKRHLSARYTEPASGEVEQRVIEDGWRRLSSDGKDPIETGPLNTRYEWQAEGDYIFRTKVFAKSGAPARIAILISGRDLPEPTPREQLDQLVGNAERPMRLLSTVEVQATSRESAQLIEVPVPKMRGRGRVLVALYKPGEGQPPAVVNVEYFALEGPLDPRPESQRQLLAANPDLPQSEQTREVLTRFLRRAYRRPPTRDELERVAAFVDSTVASGEKWEAGMQYAIQAVLCSPKFLFRVELDDTPQSPDKRPLDEFQIASRLAYFLWSSMPDDELLDLAGQGQLTANLEQQVRRMLADPKSRALVDNFAMQWLQIQRLTTLSPDAKLFPNFNEQLRAAMLEETSRFFESILREDRRIPELIDADYTFLNEPLARLYGIVDTQGNLAGQPVTRRGGEPIRGGEFRRVSLQDRRRGGLLTQASVLTVTSNPNRTSPVKRGRWVLEQILGEPPPPPPPNVPELAEDQESTLGASLRTRLEIHRRNPSCANCHAKMDPIGFALENYNAIGGFRTRDGEFEIDPSGEFADGAKFQGVEDLKSIVSGKKDLLARCLTEKLMTFALGRGVEYYDRPIVEQIVRTITSEDDRFSRLVIEIVQSEPFRYRRGTDMGD